MCKAVVCDLEPLMDAVAEHTADAQGQRAGGNLIAGLGREGWVGQVDARGVVRRRRRAQPFPWLPVSEGGVVADEPRVIGEYALLTLGGDLAVEIRHHERAAMVDG